MPVNDRIQLRRGTEDQWIAAEAADADAEPLADGEPGVVVDADGVPLYLVVGDTGTEFEALPRFSPDSALSGAFVTQTEFDEQGPSGREIAYAESTVAQTDITTATDLTGLVVTSFTVGSRPVVVEAFLPGIYGTTVGTGVQVFITDASNTITALAGFTCAVDSDVRLIIARERITTPGTYTRKVRAARNAGTGTVGNGFGLATVTSSISVTER